VNHLQKIGGLGALFTSGLSALTLVLFLIILPSQGLTDESDPGQVLTLARSSPAVIIALSLGGLTGAAAILVVTAFYERLRGTAPAIAILGAVVGVVAIVLLIANGGVYLFGVIRLAGLYRRNPAAAASAFLPLRVVAAGLGDTGFVAYGVWSLLACGLARQAARLPRLIAYLGLTWGALVILTSFYSNVEPIGVLVGIVWYFGLGLALWRQPPGQSMPSSPDAR
jgi:hypothetical protein